MMSPATPVLGGPDTLGTCHCSQQAPYQVTVLRHGARIGLVEEQWVQVGHVSDGQGQVG